MKICITAQGDNLDAQMDPRFGRCAYFLIVDTETEAVDVIHNNGGGAGGSGIQAGQTMADQGVTAVLTGNVGPNAFQTLQAAGITAYTGLAGTAREALMKFKNGELTDPLSGPSVESHFGQS